MNELRRYSTAGVIKYIIEIIKKDFNFDLVEEEIPSNSIIAIKNYGSILYYFRFNKFRNDYEIEGSAECTLKEYYKQMEFWLKDIERLNIIVYKSIINNKLGGIDNETIRMI